MGGDTLHVKTRSQEKKKESLRGKVWNAGRRKGKLHRKSEGRSSVGNPRGTTSVKKG